MKPSEHRCDLLVIGGGLAGMQAALDASRLGAEVIIASEQKVGRSGNSVIAEGGYAAPFGHGDPRDNPDAFYEDILRSGQFVNDRGLARVLAEGSCRGVEELRRAGIPFRMQGERYVQKHYPGHTYPRNCYLVQEGGIHITLPLLEHLRGRSVGMLPHSYALRLVVAESACCGAVFCDTRSGTVFVVRSNATILACGGAGAIYRHSTNVTGATGDGYALALEAGAALRDMEFVQFYPTVMLAPVRNFLMDFSPFGRRAPLLNHLGERFLERYAPDTLESCTRDVKSRAIFTEVREERGVKGGVMMEISALPRQELETYTPRFCRVFSRRGLDPHRERLVVAPAAHFFMGGVVIDERCRTAVPGLFACGEVTGGLHGANRLADNALSECQVFGGIAGREGAHYALQRTLEEETSPGREPPTLRSAGPSPSLRWMARLREVMWEQVGIARDKAGLEEAITELGRLREEVGYSLTAASGLELYRVTKVRNAVLTGLMVAKAALARRESRGAHFRKDFPFQEKECAKSIFLEPGGKGRCTARLEEG
jgi:succinate dehydrogenase/fumarate reductase flavoprotein subunit